MPRCIGAGRRIAPAGRHCLRAKCPGLRRAVDLTEPPIRKRKLAVEPVSARSARRLPGPQCARLRPDFRWPLVAVFGCPPSGTIGRLRGVDQGGGTASGRRMWMPHARSQQGPSRNPYRAQRDAVCGCNACLTRAADTSERDDPFKSGESTRELDCLFAGGIDSRPSDRGRID